MRVRTIKALVGGTDDSSEQLLTGYDNLERAKMARVSAHTLRLHPCHCYVCRAHIGPPAAVEWLRGLRGVVTSVVMSMMVGVVPGQP